MSQLHFPDPDRSRALLIGAGQFVAAGPDLPEIPAVQANLTDLRHALTNPDTGVLRPERCQSLAHPTNVDEVGTALATAAATANDLLLVYYAGHGLVDERGRLHLALAHTSPDRIRWTALPLELLREEIAASGAATRVLVLDCCFSGRAIETMADSQSVISGQLDVAGTYTLTSTTANAPAHAPFGERYTAFTSALLRALDEADPLTLDQIYGAVDRDLAARNLPRPQRRTVNAAGDLALSRGPATRPHTERTDSDEVRFAVAHPAKRVLLRVFRGLFWVALLAFFFYILGSRLVVLLTTWSGDLNSDDFEGFAGFLIYALIQVLVVILAIILSVSIYLAAPILVMLAILGSLASLAALILPMLVSSRNKEVHVRGFAVDRSGLTVEGTRARIHLPWRDIVQVGVLEPEHGRYRTKRSNSKQSHEDSRQELGLLLTYYRIAAQPKQKHILVVRSRAEVPVPGFVNVLSDEHRQLGYIGLCMLEDIRASLPEIIRALERFAGSKLNSLRQFLDRDPRLQPDMV